MAEMSDVRPIGVVGAGPCGLAACKVLGESGLEVECLEAGDRVGGVWNLERQPSGAYRSLHTNTSTRAMAFSDFPFPDGATTYPSARELQAYFEAYASRFGLHDHIRFGERVTRAHPLDGGGWRVEAAGGDARDYRALVVASGQYVAPRWPSPGTPGTFSGERLHVFDYFDPTTPIDCRGKRVVVVGLGSSAAELASELCDAASPLGCAERVILSARSGRWVVPKMVGGVPIDHNGAHPADPLPDELKALAPAEREAFVRRMFGAGIRGIAEQAGAFDGLGLPEPTIEPWQERPTMSMEFIPALKKGRIEVRPDIARFDGHAVEFTDGSRVEADVIVYATGYTLSFPFLSEDVLGCEASELALYRYIAHADHDDLFFVGCQRVTCSMWPLAEQQSLWIARRLTGEFALPDASERLRSARSLAHSDPVLCSLYADELRCDTGRS